MPLDGSGSPPIRPGLVQTIGRDLDSDIVISDLTVSRRHALIRHEGSGATVTDLGSGNGTFVNGLSVSSAEVTHGDVVSFGLVAFQLTERGLAPYESPSSASLVAQDLVVRTSAGKVILDHVSFALEPGQLLAVVGTTGAGKSTLTKALTGFRPADAGRVLLDGRDFYAGLEELQAQVGYVPQDDILHVQLRLRAALDYGARLRFSSDVSPADRSSRVTEVMHELGLSQHGNTRIQALSGGQRKRTSVALEMLTQPGVLLLDEPTSGLDPGYEKKVMELLRHLADGQRTVVVVTHSVQSLHLCDRIMFLAPGGRVAYFGPPAEVAGFFEGRDFPEIFSVLEDDRDGAWAARFRSSPLGARYLDAPLKRVPQPQTSAANGRATRVRPGRQPVQQAMTLAARQAAVMTADMKQFSVLVGATVLGGLAILAAMQANALDIGHPPPVDGRKLLGTLGLAGSVLGAAAGLREIVKERSILRRERATGLSLAAYLVSKAALLGAVCLVQGALLTLLATGRAAGPSDGALLPFPLIELILGAGAMTVAGMALGLLISALVETSEQAMGLIVLVIIFEYLFSGAAIDLAGKPFLQLPAYAAGANWGVAAMASTSNLPALDGCGTGGPPGLACDGRWGHNAVQWLWNMGGLGVLTAATLGLTLYVLHRQDRPRAR